MSQVQILSFRPYKKTASLLRWSFHIVQGAEPLEIKVSAVLGNMEICLGLLEGGVSEELLEVINASAVLKIPGGEGVAQ